MAQSRLLSTGLFPYRAAVIAYRGLASCGIEPQRFFFVASASPNAFATSSRVGTRQGSNVVPAVVATTRVPSRVPQKSSCRVVSSAMPDLLFNERNKSTGRLAWSLSSQKLNINRSAAA